MAERLRLCSGAEGVQKFARVGWTVARQRGSHVMMVKIGYEYTLSVPQHNELGPGSSSQAHPPSRSHRRRIQPSLTRATRSLSFTQH